MLVGDTSVGKTSFIDRLVNNTFGPPNYTIGVEFQILTHKRNGHLFKLQIWDQAGKERFRAITAQFF